MVRDLIGRWGAPLVLLCLLWAAMAKGDAGSWMVGLPTILFALVAFDRLRERRGRRERRERRIRLRALPGFVAWFLWHSLRGGADVAWRALQPRMPLNPGFLRYRMTVPPGLAQVFLINCVSLLPGTLSAGVVGNELVLHALDTEAKVIADTREVERRVQKLYGIPASSIHG